MATVELTDKEVRVLKMFLGFDHDRMGFERAEIRVLNGLKKKFMPKALREASKPAEPREIIVGDVEGALFDMMSRGMQDD